MGVEELEEDDPIRRQMRGTTASSSLTFSLGVLLFLSVFTFESVFSKTAGSATSVLAISALILIPLSSPQRFARVQTLLAGARLFVPILTLAAIYLVLQPMSVVPDGAEQGARTAVYLVAMFSAGVIGFCITRGRGLHVLALGASALLLIAATWWVRGFNEESTYGFAQTKNVVSGAVMHSAIFLALLVGHRWPSVSRRAFIWSVLACLVVAMAASQRAMVPAAVIALLMSWALSRRWANTGTAILLFVLFLCAEWTIFVFISQLNSSPSLLALNELARELTGRRFTSGREELWQYGAYYLGSSPWFGLGTGVAPGDLFSTHLASIHNSFLHVAMQVGCNYPGALSAG